jgi:hypothetical protein
MTARSPDIRLQHHDSEQHNICLSPSLHSPLVLKPPPFPPRSLSCPPCQTNQHKRYDVELPTAATDEDEDEDEDEGEEEEEKVRGDGRDGAWDGARWGRGNGGSIAAMGATLLEIARNDGGFAPPPPPPPPLLLLMPEDIETKSSAVRNIGNRDHNCDPAIKRARRSTGHNGTTKTTVE